MGTPFVCANFRGDTDFRTSEGHQSSLAFISFQISEGTGSAIQKHCRFFETTESPHQAPLPLSDFHLGMGDQFGVGTVAGHEFFVLATLHHFAVVQNDDLVTVSDGT